MRDLRRRSSEVEVMDDLNCDGEVVAQTLRELNVINTRLGGNSISTNAMASSATSDTLINLFILTSVVFLHFGRNRLDQPCSIR